MKKKLGVLFLALVSIFMVASCNNDPETTTSESGTGTTTPSATATSDNSQAIVDAAKAALELDDEEVSEDFTLKTQGSGATIITWGSSNEDYIKIDGQNAIVTQPVDTEVVVTLTATIQKGTASATKTFEVTVLPMTFSTYNQWVALTDTAIDITISGVVVGKEVYSDSYKNTTVYLADMSGTGGYVGYRMSCDSLDAYNEDLAIGNRLAVTGKKTVYNSLPEFSSCTYKVLSKNNPVAAYAIDEYVGTNLDKYIGRLVTVTGDIQIGANQTTPPTAAYSITLNVGDEQIVCRVNPYLIPVAHADWTTIAQKAVAGYTVETTGVLVRFYDSYQFYPRTADDFVVIDEEPTDIVMVRATMAEIKAEIPTIWTTTKTLDLPALGTTYTNATVTYEIKEDKAEVADLADNSGVMQLTITPLADNSDVILTVTVTCGEVIKSFDITISTGVVPYTLAEYNKAIENVTDKIGGYAVVQGVITGVNYNSATKVVQAYLDCGTYGTSLYGFDVSGYADYTSVFSIGNTICIMGNVVVYQGLYQFSSSVDKNIIVTLMDDTTTVTETPIDITADVLAGNNISKYQGQYVTIKGATFKEVTSSTNQVMIRKGYLTVGSGEDQKSILLAVNSYFYSSNELLACVGDDLEVDFVGLLAWNTSTTLGAANVPMLLPVEETAITVKDTAANATALINAKYKFTLEEIEALFGPKYKETKEITLPNTGSIFEDVLIRYEIDEANTVLSLVDGVLTITPTETPTTCTVTVILTIDGQDKDGYEIEFVASTAPFSATSTYLLSQTATTFTATGDYYVAYNHGTGTGVYAYMILQNENGNVTFFYKSATGDVMAEYASWTVGTKLTITGATVATGANDVGYYKVLTAITYTGLDKTNTSVPAITNFTTIDFAVDGDDYLEYLKTHPEMLGSYVEFKNVTFQKAVTGSVTAGYSYIDENCAEINFGLYNCKLSTTIATYDMKGYVVGANKLPSAGTSTSACIVRFQATSLTLVE